MNKVNKSRAVTEILNGVVWNRKITRKSKLQIYNSIVKSSVTYGAETQKFNKNQNQNLCRKKLTFCGDHRDVQDLKKYK